MSTSPTNERATKDVNTVSISKSSDRSLAEIERDMHLGLTPDEMSKIRSHFSGLGREPTDIELHSIAQAWSEHCSYKTSKPVLRRFVFPLGERAFAKGDAGVMDFDELHVYSLKMESHNHPSAIEPYGGAGTGIGGIVRDILCMGTKPIALADPLFFGDLDTSLRDLPSGDKHPKYLFAGVVGGIRDYGNRIGVPTVSGGLWFDERYLSNCLVNAGCVGFGEKKKIVGNAFNKVGDRIVIAGGLTGRDGIHGVNFASKVLTAGSHESDRGAVQLGDPITKEPLINAVLQLANEGMIDAMKDLGGGGLSAVAGEMALSGSLSAVIDIDAVPLRERGMLPWEIWVSESQERMLLAVDPKNLDHVLEVFDFWDVRAANIGTVESGSNIIVTHLGEKIVDMDTAFSVKSPEYNRPMQKRKLERARVKELDLLDNLEKMVDRMLSDINMCSRDWVVHQYDYEVGGRTVIKPLHGIPGKLSHGDAAVLKPLENSWKGLAVATASQPWIGATDPYQGGVATIDELCRQLVSVGAKPDAVTNCLNFGNPERPQVMWEFYETVRGMADAASSMNIAVPSGNVSFYNDGESGPILPTLALMGVGLVKDVRRSVTSDLKKDGSYLYLIGKQDNRLGCSELSRIYKTGDIDFAPVDLKRLSSLSNLILRVSSEGLLLSCHDVSQGGIFLAAAEMAMGGNTGLVLDTSTLGRADTRAKLFSEAPTRWIVEVSPDNSDKIASLFGQNAHLLGTTGSSKLAVMEEGRVRYSREIEHLRKIWQTPIWERMGSA